MQTVVNLDADVEKLLRQNVHDRNLDFDRVLNEAVRAGLSMDGTAQSRRFVQKTYELGSNRIDLTKALALADELDDAEMLRKRKLANQE